MDTFLDRDGHEIIAMGNKTETGKMKEEIDMESLEWSDDILLESYCQV